MLFLKNWQKIQFVVFIMVEIFHTVWLYLIALTQFCQLLLGFIFYSYRGEVPSFTYIWYIYMCVYKCLVIQRFPIYYFEAQYWFQCYCYMISYIFLNKNKDKRTVSNLKLFKLSVTVEYNLGSQFFISICWNKFLFACLFYEQVILILKALSRKEAVHNLNALIFWQPLNCIFEIICLWRNPWMSSIQTYACLDLK